MADSDADTRERKRIAKKEWRRAHPELERAANRRKSYGLTQAQFDDLLAKQGGRCAICRAKQANAVDHSHARGHIRGLLCRACNAGLGFFRDDPGLLRAAAAYLKAK